MKMEIVRDLAEKYNTKQCKTKGIIEDFIERIKECTCSGEDVELRGFGIFKPILQKGRKSNLPNVPGFNDKLSIKFIVGKDWKEKLNDL